MIIYHEVHTESLDSVLQHGLKRTSRGEKGDDSLVVKTDLFLDAKRPRHIKQAGISRDNNLYGYMSVDGKIIDIYPPDKPTAPIRSIAEFLQNDHHHSVILQLNINVDKCYISDLHFYDKIKKAIERGEPSSYLNTLAEQYWNNIQPLREKMPVSSLPNRPEVMITYDISPDNIEVIH